MIVQSTRGAYMSKLGEGALFGTGFAFAFILVAFGMKALLKIGIMG